MENETKETQSYELLYSPRTTYSKQLETEEILYNDLTLNFDPITIKIIKKHFKERLGSLKEIEFIAILKNHLLSWHPDLCDREKVLIKLLHRLFSEIDLNDNENMEWSEFTNYIIHNSNSMTGKDDEPDSSDLRMYAKSRTAIDRANSQDSIAFAFCIEKYNLLGVVEEGRGIIEFYDSNNFKRLDNRIDLHSIQKDIDELEDNLLIERTSMNRTYPKKDGKFETNAYNNTTAGMDRIETYQTAILKKNNNEDKDDVYIDVQHFEKKKKRRNKLYTQNKKLTVLSTSNHIFKI
jgi:hypothetical protein